jgi:hypothetical protein
MAHINPIPTFILLVVIGIAGIGASLWRIAHGGAQRLFGIASLILLGGVLVLVISINLMFQQVSNAVNSNGPTTFPQFQTTPIPWSTVPSFSTPSGPGMTINP